MRDSYKMHFAIHNFILKQNDAFILNEFEKNIEV